MDIQEFLVKMILQMLNHHSKLTLCFASDFTVSDAATSTATYWSVQDPDGTKLTDQTITATAEETIQSTLGWLSGLFG